MKITIAKLVGIFVVITCTYGLGMEEEQKMLPDLEYVYKSLPDTSKNCYLKVLPKGKVTGLLIGLNGSLPQNPQTFAPAKLHNMAAEQGIMTVYAVPGDIFADFYVSDTTFAVFDEMIHEVMTKHDISKNKFIVMGGSLSGAGAAKYAQYCVLGKSKNGLSPAGVFAWDPILDFERMWREQFNALNRNYHEAAAKEGKWVVPIMRKIFGGSPEENLQNYQTMSPFCYSAKDGGNAALLVKTRIRLVTEADINWWIENRSKDYYDINSVDCAALVNQLRILGNNQAELIVTSGKGYREDGTRHPHSWSIVDEEDTLKWVLKVFKEVE